MPIIAYRRQPWPFVDQLVFDLAPSGFDIVPIARDASPSDRAAALAEAEYLMGSWVTTSVKLVEEDFRAAPRLKLLQVMSAGYEHVPLDLAARYGVAVATFGDAMASVVAEHTVLLMLAVYRRLLTLDAAVRSGAWRTKEPPLRELRGKQVGLIGFGFIAQAVVERLRGFGVSLVYTARQPHPDTADRRVRYVNLDELLQTSDVVSVHVALATSTRGLIGARELALMKPEAILINTARGGVVDQAALREALASGRLAGAGLDVLEPEPPSTEDPLLQVPTVVLSPHNAGQSEAVWPRIVQTCFDNVQRVNRGAPPRFVARPLD